MPSLTLARPDQLASIYRESRALWGSGLAMEDYVGLWHDLMDTDWGRLHSGLYAWTDGRDRLLSSVKLYEPRLRVGGQVSRATVIGALFTPSRRRRRGHAASLVRAVLARARQRGHRHVLLFTDIGAEFYEALGFRALPAEEHGASLPAEAGAPPGWSLRPEEERDLEPVQAAHGEACRARSLAMIRDPEHWRYLEVRSARFFERVNDPRMRYHRQVAEYRGRFVGYLVTVSARREWHVREVGAPGGDLAAMAHVIRLGAAQARSAGFRRLYGWLPPEVVPLLPDLGIRTRTRTRAAPMVASLGGARGPQGAPAALPPYLSFLDQF